LWKNKQGFTLLEILTVTAMISIFILLLIEMDLGLRRQFNWNENYLTLISEGREFMNILEEDLISGAIQSKNLPQIDAVEPVVVIKIHVPDRKTGTLSYSVPHHIVYYIPADKPGQIVRSITDPEGNTKPYHKKIVVQHLKEVTVLKSPTDKSPLLDILLELEKIIPEYPPIIITFRNQMGVVL